MSMHSPLPSVNSAEGQISSRNSRLDPFGLAAGLLKNDRVFVLSLLLILSSTALADLALVLSGISLNWGWLVISDKLIQVAAVFAIATRWRSRLYGQVIGDIKDPLSRLKVFLRIALISLTSALLLGVPFIGVSVNLIGGSGALLFFTIGILGVVWCLRVYFFFAIAAILGLPLASGLAAAVNLSKRDRSAALRSIATPVAVTMLLTALLSLGSPDGRSLYWTAAVSAGEGIFWILSSYTALAYALVIFNDAEWRAAGLTPYRGERLSTIQAQGDKRLAKILKPKSGLLVALLALSLMAVNLQRNLTTPPAAKVSIIGAAVEDYSIKIELEVVDPEYKFRGFQPLAFSIKTKTGSPFAESLKSVARTSDGQGFITGIQSVDGSRERIFLSFSSAKTARTIRGSDNVWLWYKSVPLMPIDPAIFSSSTATPTPVSTTTL